METNSFPAYDMSDNPTGCCPHFKPEGWGAQTIRLDDKLFVRATTKSILHFPLNIGPVFAMTCKAIEDAGADAKEQFIVLSHDMSLWSAEHFFAVTKDVPGQEMVRLSGDFRTKVFEGAFKNVPTWQKQVVADLEAQGEKVSKTYFFYTTCPKCAKAYGENYVVAIAQVGG